MTYFLPGPGAFTPGSRSNAAAADLINQWLEYDRNQMGGSGEVLTAVGWAVTATQPQIYIANQGGAAEGFLDHISTTDIAPGQIVRIRMANYSQKFFVRSGISNLVLSTTAMRFGETGFESLWLEFSVDGHWFEVDRAYGPVANSNFAYYWRHDHGIDGQGPIPGYPATFSSATNSEAQAGTSDRATMTPAATAQALANANLMIDNRGQQTSLNPGMTFLVSLGSVLYKLNLLTLLQPSFSSYVETGELGVAAGAGGFFAHGIGGQPNLVRGYFRCKADDNGFQAGFEVPAECICSDITTRRVTFGATPVNAFWRMSNVGNIIITDRTTGADITLTNANWRFFMRLWR